VPLKKSVVEVLVPIVEKMADELKNSRGQIAAIIELVKTIVQATTMFFALGPQAAKGVLDTLPKRLAQAIVGALKGDGDDVEGMIDAAINDLLKQEGAAVGVPDDPVKKAAQQALDIPLFR
jgi:hypothetical protein